eukprot:3844927-Alexandrium_andersonii.AAC.1
MATVNQGLQGHSTADTRVSVSSALLEAEWKSTSAADKVGVGMGGGSARRSLKAAALVPGPSAPRRRRKGRRMLLQGPFGDG